MWSRDTGQRMPCFDRCQLTITLIKDLCCKLARVSTDLIHDGRHVGFAIIMQISYSLLKGQTTQVREVITNTLATQMICFMFIEFLSPKQ